MSTFTHPATTTNEHGFTVSLYRAKGGDLTLFEYLRRDFAALVAADAKRAELEEQA